MADETQNDDNDHYNEHQSNNSNNQSNTSSSCDGSKEQQQQLNGSNQSNQDADDDICRDYLRNVCRRGQSCKYRHPDEGDYQSIEKVVDFVFCHDYQNRECRRTNCRFVHATKQEEDIFHSTGKLPQHVIDRLTVMKGYGDLVGTLVTGGPPETIPICKDFLKGECRRGHGRCKFRHLTQREADMEMGMLSSGHGNSGPHGHNNNMGHRPPGHQQLPPHHASPYGHLLGHHTDSHGRFLPPPGHGHGHPGHGHPYGHPGQQVPPPPPPSHLVNGNHPHSNPYGPPLPPQHLHGHGPPPHMARGGYGPPPPPGPPSASSASGSYPPARGYGRRDPFLDGPVYVPPEKKSRNFDPFSNDDVYPSSGDPSTPSSTSRVPPGGPQPPPVPPGYGLEDENVALRRRVEDLKKQVADLMATNEFLLEQNAQLRSNKSSGGNNNQGSGQVTTGTVTALAAVTSGPGNNGQQAINVTPVGVTTATVELPVVSIGSLSAVTGLPVSSIAASLSNAIISTSTPSAIVTSGHNSLVTYPHIVATSTSLKAEYHHSLNR